RVWVRTIGRAVKDEKGEIIRVEGSFQDINESKQKQKALQESEDRLSKIVIAANDGMWDWDLTTNEVYFDPRYYTMAGYEVNEFPHQLKEFQKRVHPEDIENVMFYAEQHLKGKIERFQVEFRFKMKTGNWMWIAGRGYIVERDENGNPLRLVGTHRDITESKNSMAALQQIEWMLSEKKAKDEDFTPEYGDLSELNKNGLILSSVGKNQLTQIASEYLDLLETSSAIYEINGDYALGLFSSGWCKMMDNASRKLCKTDDNQQALKDGKWLCHESCWHDTSLQAIESGKPADVECNGGLHIYAVPISAGGKVIGAINFGYGDPPEADTELQSLSKLYQIPIEELRKKGQEYQTRPQFIIDYAKKRIQFSAQYIANIVERNLAEAELRELKDDLEIQVVEKTKELNERIAELERFHDATIEREFRIKELSDEIEKLKREVRDE
ncbi:MAG: PAS domain-containing protein, partial [Kosmotogaceae bacterium]|nr:PAS domain-containing protein [Kosmotogaceae bacterium]